MSARVYEIRPPIVVPSLIDAIFAAVCVASAAYIGPTAIGGATMLVGVGLIAGALRRLRRADRVTLDGDRVGWNDRWYPLTDVVVGPYFWPRRLHRAFVATFVDDDGPRTVILTERATRGFAELHIALGRATRADLRVFYPDAARLHELLSVLGALALVIALACALGSVAGDDAAERAGATAVFVPAALLAVAMLASLLIWPVRAPMVVDHRHARVYYGAWYPADAVHVGPLDDAGAGPAKGPRFELTLHKKIAVHGLVWPDVSAVHAALVALVRSG